MDCLDDDRDDDLPLKCPVLCGTATKPSAPSTDTITTTTTLVASGTEEPEELSDAETEEGTDGGAEGEGEGEGKAKPDNDSESAETGTDNASDGDGDGAGDGDRTDAATTLYGCIPVAKYADDADMAMLCTGYTEANCKTQALFCEYRYEPTTTTTPSTTVKTGCVVGVEKYKSDPNMIAMCESSETVEQCADSTPKEMFCAFVAQATTATTAEAETTSSAATTTAAATTTTAAATTTTAAATTTTTTTAITTAPNTIATAQAAQRAHIGCTAKHKYEEDDVLQATCITLMSASDCKANLACRYVWATAPTPTSTSTSTSTPITTSSSNVSSLLPATTAAATAGAENKTTHAQWRCYGTEDPRRCQTIGLDQCDAMSVAGMPIKILCPGLCNNCPEVPPDATTSPAPITGAGSNVGSTTSVGRITGHVTAAPLPPPSSTTPPPADANATTSTTVAAAHGLTKPYHIDSTASTPEPVSSVFTRTKTTASSTTKTATTTQKPTVAECASHPMPTCMDDHGCNWSMETMECIDMSVWVSKCQDSPLGFTDRSGNDCAYIAQHGFMCASPANKAACCGCGGGAIGMLVPDGGVAGGAGSADGSKAYNLKAAKAYSIVVGVCAAFVAFATVFSYGRSWKSNKMAGGLSPHKKWALQEKLYEGNDSFRMQTMSPFEEDSDEADDLVFFKK